MVGEDAGDQVGEVAGAARAAAQDVHQHEVDARQEQRVEDQPELPEDGVEVLRPQLRARELERERAPAPDLADVRPERRQPHDVGLVDVVLRREFVLGAVMLRGGGGHGGL